MSLTTAQLEAITARGNVLVVAGAGTGKTRTLVERCLACLFQEATPALLDEILVVTFTEAAAAEVRRRIRDRLAEQQARQPREPLWQEQLALFETAHVGTLHSFCFQLVRQHFYELELDPQLKVLAEDEAHLLAQETLDAMLQRHYAGQGGRAEAVQLLIQAQGRGWDQPIRTLILKIHRYTQTLPGAEAWITRQLDHFAAAQPGSWPAWLLEGFAGFRRLWLPVLHELAPGNETARQTAAALSSAGETPSRTAVAAALERVLAAERDCPYGKKGVWMHPIASCLKQAAFLASLAGSNSGDPLAEDWAWVREQMTTLLLLAREFATAFAESKRELGLVDFQDLEQHALRLLWDPARDQPTEIALQWRRKLRFVMVDEYQDINAAQDRIIEALSRPGEDANRFLVGDVKQSIYRFRLANPRIFLDYASRWAGGQGGRVIPLLDNFRSREGILNFVNSLFGLLMQPELGGLAYDEMARLKFKGQFPPETAAQGAVGRRVELHWQIRTKADPQNGEEEEERPDEIAEVKELGDVDKEARLAGLRLLELKSRPLLVWDESLGRGRPAEWRDMAILLRSPANRTESFAKEFARLRIPLEVARGGFYESLEISDLVTLLQLLDNPLQDLPLLAVLRSPLVGLTLDELARIRLTAARTHFWTALIRWKNARTRSTGEDQAGRKVPEFLERFNRWRRLARQVSLSRCLEAVLAETHYESWLLTQPRGEQRRANVQRLLGLAREFDRFQRQGLFRFLRYVEAQQSAEAEPEVAPSNESNAVRLMSIHQSKGLEFPVVLLADLAKAFNTTDLHSEIVLDEEYGLCPQVKPPGLGRSYPSLPYWLACQRQRRQLLGEELRLLYVATTRARDALLLTGTISAGKFEQSWEEPDVPRRSQIFSARSYADWINAWFAQQLGPADKISDEGENQWLRWQAHHEASLLAGAPAEGPSGQAGTSPVEAERWRALVDRLSWQYPFEPATRQPAKTSVSVLRRQAVQDAVEDAAARPFPPAAAALRPSGTAADAGTAHHSFLQKVALARVGTLQDLESEAQRLVRSGALTAEAAALLDFPGLAAFWDSDLGRKVRLQGRFVRREVPFTARFTPAELARLAPGAAESGGEDEFVVVQGVVDLAVVLPREIWILDFKTDAAQPDDSKVREYEPQLRLYAHALSTVYGRRVADCWLCFLSWKRNIRVSPLPSRG